MRPTEDVAALQGYLMKEKSKDGFLQSLTEDINRRYFKVQRIEMSDELALCYYKKSIDPEVRGWIYLKDVAQIAEDKDTMTITSAARTLHLYAQTRAEHNMWVKGLAKLCPSAFLKLERNAAVVEKERVSKATPSLDATQSPTKKDCFGSIQGTGSHSNKNIVRLADDYRQIDSADDDDNNSDSAYESLCSRTVSNYSERPESRKSETAADGDFGGPRCRPLCQHNAALVELESENLSGGSTTVALADNHTESVGLSHERRSKCHGQGSSKSTKYDGNQSFNLDKSRGPTCDSRGRSVSKGSSGKHERRLFWNTEGQKPPCATGIGDSHTQLEVRGDRADKSAGATSSSDCEELGKRDVSKTPSLVKSHHNDETFIRHMDQPWRSTSGTEEHVGQKVQACSDIEDAVVKSGNVNIQRLNRTDGQESMVERSEGPWRFDAGTIDLNKSKDWSQKLSQSDGWLAQTTGIEEQNNPAQDEDMELDQREEIALLTPSFEISWESPRRRKTAAHQLHRRVSRRNENESENEDNPPPPKEFLTTRKPKHCTDSRPLQQLGGTTTDKDHRLQDKRCSNSPGSVIRFRRRSAADLEWGECSTPQKIRENCIERKLVMPVDIGPINLSDSGDDEGSDWDLEAEKERRTANAAILSAKTAAKETDREDNCSSQQGTEDGTVIVMERNRRRPVLPSPSGAPPPAPSRIVHQGLDLSSPGEKVSSRKNCYNSFIYELVRTSPGHREHREHHEHNAQNTARLACDRISPLDIAQPVDFKALSTSCRRDSSEKYVWSERNEDVKTEVQAMHVLATEKMPKKDIKDSLDVAPVATPISSLSSALSNGVKNR